MELMNRRDQAGFFCWTQVRSGQRVEELESVGDRSERSTAVSKVRAGCHGESLALSPLLPSPSSPRRRIILFDYCFCALYTETVNLPIRESLTPLRLLSLLLASPFLSAFFPPFPPLPSSRQPVLSTSFNAVPKMLQTYIIQLILPTAIDLLSFVKMDKLGIVTHY